MLPRSPRQANAAPTVILTPFRSRARLPRTGEYARICPQRPRPCRQAVTLGRLRSRTAEASLSPGHRAREQDKNSSCRHLPRQRKSDRAAAWTCRGSRKICKSARCRSKAVVQLLDEGNTIPFITRYRKERTGGLDEEVCAPSRSASACCGNSPTASRPSSRASRTRAS